jgi:hypothetical protein
MNGAQLLKDRGRLVVTVCLVKVEKLSGAGQCEEQNAGRDEKADI